jgi:CrcB protein
MVKIVYILVGGAIGTYLRYAVSGYSYKLFDWIFPIGTLVVNLIGSFLIGLLWGIFEAGNLSPNIRVFLFIGILGGFTTFSSYMLETLNLYRDGEVRLAIINLFANNIFGLIMVIGGFFLSKLLVGQLK